MIELIRGDCLEELRKLDFEGREVAIVTDPPFNIGYRYSSYKDRKKKGDYIAWLKEILSFAEARVIVHYPETLHELSIALGEAPVRVVSWVYNSNTARQHRDIAYYGVKPDFRKVKQPYKNPSDKRIKERIARGCSGGRSYDWWNANQVKNVEKKGLTHPCIMPLEIMEKAIGVLPESLLIVDPFMGSGTTALACLKLNRDFIGIELDETYFEEAKERIRSSELKKETQ